MSRVRVERRPFTFRDLESNRLSGVAKAVLVTDGYIHVSSGREHVEVLTRFRDVRRLKTIEEKLLAGDYRGLESLIAAIRVGYLETVSYGGRVCVPGSTIKGLLRSRLELCPSKDGVSISCLHTVAPPITKPIPRGHHGWRHTLIWKQSVSEDRGAPCNPIETQDYSLCRVCDLFGAPGIVGRVMPSNFCSDWNTCEFRDLPYGERVLAIKPGTRLEGSISFSALTIEELGMLLIAMGMVKGSTRGVHILIGKHKYAYKDMGIAHFELEYITFPYRFREVLDLLAVEYEAKEYELVCRGEALKKLIDLAIDRALKTYPQLERLHGFSEAEVRNKVVP